MRGKSNMHHAMSISCISKNFIYRTSLRKLTSPRIEPGTLRLQVRWSITEPSARLENIKLIGVSILILIYLINLNIYATQFNFYFI